MVISRRGAHTAAHRAKLCGDERCLPGSYMCDVGRREDVVWCVYWATTVEDPGLQE